jgi:hypothetical protein
MRERAVAGIARIGFVAALAACGGKGTGLASTNGGNTPDASTSEDAAGGSVSPLIDAATDSTLVPPADASGVSRACVPGQSVACVGPGGCATNQVCDPDGSGYGLCICAQSDAAAGEACVPGESVACVGPGGCTTSQVCNASGSGYGPCACVGDASALACVPGESIACGGPGGCASFQVCNGAGSAYGPCDCPDAAADDASAAWTPAQLPGLALWFDDTYGLVMDPQHPGTVLHWLDRSGNGNEATMVGTYSAIGTTQEWYGFALDPETINGHDGIVCPVNGLGATVINVAASSGLDWGTGDFAIVVVAKYDQVAGGSLWTGNGVSLTTQSDDYFELTAGSQSVNVSPPTAGGFQVITALGQALSLDVAGTSATGGTNTTALSGGAVSICETTGWELAEVVAVKGPLAPGDLANLSTYFQTKFAL